MKLKYFTGESNNELGLENVVGFTGKPGSGKTYLSKHLGEKLEIEHISFDDDMFDLPKSKVIATMLKLLGIEHGKQKTDSIDSLASMLDYINPFEKVMIELWESILNKKMKAKLANRTNKNDPLIMDFAHLPELGVAKSFGMNVLIESDNDLRNANFSKREGVDTKHAHNFNDSVSKVVNYNKLKYAIRIRNDYQSIPTEIQAMIQSYDGTVKSLYPQEKVM